MLGGVAAVCGIRRGGERLEVPFADVGRVDDEDDGVAAGVVGLPETAQRVLAADVPKLEVAVCALAGRDVLADGWDGLEVRVRVRGVEGFDLLEEGGLAGVVEAKEEDGIFYLRREKI